MPTHSRRQFYISLKKSSYQPWELGVGQSPVPVVTSDNVSCAAWLSLRREEDRRGCALISGCGSVEGKMARTFTTQIYLNKSEHICRLVPRGQRWGGGRMGDRQKMGARQSLCGITRLQEGVARKPWGSAGLRC